MLIIFLRVSFRAYHLPNLLMLKTLSTSLVGGLCKPEKSA